MYLEMALIGKFLCTHISRRHLNNNKLRRMPGDTFEPLTGLMLLRLDHNPIHCDCSMLGLFRWLKRRTPLMQSVLCQLPRELDGRDLLQLNEADLNCSEYS